MSRRGERGQILPIGAIAIMVLIGIAGLVIDVGFTWMLLRREQAAVDAGTVAAARFIPDGDIASMRTAACFYARQYDFFQSATTNDLSGTGCVPANDSASATLSVNFPPSSGTFAGDDGYVEVVINGSHATFFSGIFGLRTFGVAADAISANASTSGTGGQLVALDPTSCKSGQIRGNGTVDVEGSIYVNSDGSTANPATGDAACPGTAAQFNNVCSGSTGAFSFAGTNARLVTPQVSVRGICGQNANPYPGNCSPPSSCGMTEGAPQIDDPFSLPVPTIAWAGVPAQALKTGGVAYNGATGCNVSQVNNAAAVCTFGGGGGANCGSYCELWPGVYYGGWDLTTTVCLHPGFYYMAGGAITQSGSGRLVTMGPGDTCAAIAAAAPGAEGGDGRILLYFTDGPNCPTSPAAGDRRCMGSSTGVFSITGNSNSAFQARGYEETNTVISGGNTDADYHRILMWVSQYQSNGTTRTRRTYPTDSNFTNDKITIAGQGALNFWGTIYTPKSVVDIAGQGSGLGDVAGVQILAWQFNIGGNGILNMPFDPNELSSILAKGLVQ